MSQFPGPIPLPDSVEQERIQRQKEVLTSATCGICIRLGVIALELAGVLIFGSSALLMDALSSLIDVASSFVLIISIKMASKPPDAHHPFGHGRLEPLAGLQLGIMLIVLGGGMFIHQSFLLNHEPSQIPLNKYTWIFPFVAMILLETCYWVVIHTAQKKNSPALAADAIHYRIDGVTSLFATGALILGVFYPEWSLTFDHLGAILIAGLMIGLGGFAAKNNLNQLMDRVPDSTFFEKVKKAALSVEGVLGTEKIRIQLYGPDAHVDIDIEVDPKLSVEVAHVEPYYPNDHL
jgi:cation diffusion facilitator family transporter